MTTADVRAQLEQLRTATDGLRSQLATIRKDLDEMSRDIRIGAFHSETTVQNWLVAKHAQKSISGALVTAFDEMEKIDVLIAVAFEAVKWPGALPLKPPPPPGGEKP
jgi:hypothetical protein